DPVQLLHREFRQRIVFVDEDDNGPGLTFQVIGAGSNRDGLEVVLERFIERKEFGEHRLTAAGADVRKAADQARVGAVAAGELVVKTNVRLILAKAVFPNLYDAAEVAAEISNDTRHFPVRLVGRQRSQILGGDGHRRQPEKSEND